MPSTSTPSMQPTYYPSLSPHSISVISTIAGTGSASYSGDGSQATSAAVNSPSGIAVDSSGNVYLSDFGNNRVRKITASTGIITTYAGTGSASYSGDGGAASSAAIYGPFGLCMDSSGDAARDTHLILHHHTDIICLLGNLYIAEFYNQRIRKVLASTNLVSTLAGTGTASFSGDNGQASSATLSYPIGVAVDTSGKGK